MNSLRLTLLSLVAAVALAACGSDDPGTTTTPRKAEIAEELPKLPRGWNPYINRAEVAAHLKGLHQMP